MQDLNSHFDAYMGSVNGIFKKNQANFASNQNNSNGSSALPTAEQDLDFFVADSAMSTPTFVNFPESSSPAGSHQGWVSEGETPDNNPRRTARRISNGIMDRVAKFENMGNGMETVSPQRPVTPPRQNISSYFPPTPMDTPHERMMKQQPPRLNRFSDDYDESMEETIKPVRSRRSRQNSSDVFQGMRQQAEGIVQTPQRSNAMSAAYHGAGLTTPDFMCMNNVNAEFVKIEHGFDGRPRGAVNISHDLCQQLSSPMKTPHMSGDAFRGSPFEDECDLRHPGLPDLRHTDFDPQGMAMTGTQSPTKSSSSRHGGSPHRRTESLASIASAASIASINIEETKTETGVTIEDIAAFIDGPANGEGKWTCLYDGCGKKFGRKENIKSHVQTHLNDRQYQCPTCKKCFVRQHDLKRHAKIHTGIKPYPCECGNSFARHDALTRHRQRGMCIGAFDGVVRKVVKRGRPRKNRPDMDERRDKRERTRRKNNGNAHDLAAAVAGSSATTSPSSASSQSGYSEDSSAANSPCNDFDGMLDDRPFQDIMGVDMDDMDDMDPSSPSAAIDGLPTTVSMDPVDLSVSSAPIPDMTAAGLDISEVLRVVSPEQIHSPSARSHYSHMSHASIGGGDELDNNTNQGPPTCPGSPAKSIASQYTHQPGTTPELSASSSPPGGFFGLDANSSGLSDGLDGGNGGVGGVSSSMSLEEEMMLFGSSEDGLVQLDRELMLGAKFDDDYDAVAMFTNNEDMFFNSA